MWSGHCLENQCSVSGREVSQIDKPFSCANFTDVCNTSGRVSSSICMLLSILTLLFFLTSALVLGDVWAIAGILVGDVGTEG